MPIKFEAMITSIYLVSLMFLAFARGHYHTSYFRDQKDFQDRPTFLGDEVFSRLSDDFPVNKLTILGTHNSAAYDNLTPFVQCQALSIMDQLLQGTRLLDLRLRRTSPRALSCHHGVVYLKKNFNDVLSEVLTFLHYHPRESVILALKEDYKPDGDQPPLCTVLDEYLERNGKENFLLWNSFEGKTIKDMRGKILLISKKNFDSCNLFSYKRCQIQNYWKLEGIRDLYDKWLKIKDHAYDAIQSTNKSECYVTYLSGSNPSKAVYPDFVVSGHLPPFGTKANRMPTGNIETKRTKKPTWPDFPRAVCPLKTCLPFFEGTNTLFYEWFLKNAETLIPVNSMFMILTDYFGPALAEGVMAVNILRDQKRTNTSVQLQANPLSIDEYSSTTIINEEITVNSSAD